MILMINEMKIYYMNNYTHMEKFINNEDELKINIKKVKKTIIFSIITQKRTINILN